MRCLLLLALVVGCPPLPPADTGSVDDDDDATSDHGGTGTCSEVGAPGVLGDVPCPEPALGEPRLGDVWTVTVAAGEQLRVVVDTVDLASTFDPRVRIVDALNTFLASGDDDCVCDFSAGADYGCAEATHEADFDEVVHIEVAGFLEEACAADVGAYVLRVAIEGEPVTPTLTADDGPTHFDSR